MCEIFIISCFLIYWEWLHVSKGFSAPWTSQPYFFPLSWCNGRLIGNQLQACPAIRTESKMVFEKDFWLPKIGTTDSHCAAHIFQLCARDDDALFPMPKNQAEVRHPSRKLVISSPRISTVCFSARPGSVLAQGIPTRLHLLPHTSGMGRDSQCRWFSSMQTNTSYTDDVLDAYHQ